MAPFTNPDYENLVTHNDPDWLNMTYGDVCTPGRGGALRNVVAGDILLFWGLLWCNNGDSWPGFVHPARKGWYLFGALRVEEIVGPHNIDAVDPQYIARAQQNIHFQNHHLPANERVFLGNPQSSRRFDRAVDLGVQGPHGLIYQALTSANGNPLYFNGNPHWYSSLRACRKMWDLNDPRQLERAERARDAIQNDNPHFDLLEGVVG
jgi:hypothetical protein